MSGKKPSYSKLAGENESIAENIKWMGYFTGLPVVANISLALVAIVSLSSANPFMITPLFGAILMSVLVLTFGVMLVFSYKWVELEGADARVVNKRYALICYGWVGLMISTLESVIFWTYWGLNASPDFAAAKKVADLPSNPNLYVAYRDINNTLFMSNILLAIGIIHMGLKFSKSNLMSKKGFA